MPSDVFRRTFVGARGGELVFYREGATDTVGVVEYGGQRRIAYEDQRGTAATWSYPVGYVFGHMPVLLHPGHPKKGLHICFGVGNSLSAMAAHESIERVDNVELSPHVAEAAKYFWTNNGILHDPRVDTIIDDGRNFVMASGETYDVIALEPPETFTAGVINLYTREFYEDVEKRLAEDGMLVQWIPVGEGTLDEEKMLFRSFFDVFPHATVWQQLSRDGNIMLVGSKQPLRIDYQLLQSKMNERRVRRDLELSKVHDPVDLLSMFIFGPERYAEFVRGVPPVVDDKTVLDFAIPRRIGSGFGTGFFVANAREEGITPLGAITRRTQYYYRTRGSPLPHLTNLGGVDPRELDLEIRRRERPSNAEVLIPIAESDWNRWPAEAREG
jgi:spermidine synthase